MCLKCKQRHESAVELFFQHLTKYEADDSENYVGNFRITNGECYPGLTKIIHFLISGYIRIQNTETEEKGFF